jgi:hypothetical protein
VSIGLGTLGRIGRIGRGDAEHVVDDRDPPALREPPAPLF